ncbi:MAG: diguanylate cyclase [Candidatus Thiodiazotropha sp. DIVDIV]
MFYWYLVFLPFSPSRGYKYNTMLVLLKGEAEVWRTRQDGLTYQINTYEAGGVFGVTSLVSNRERTADVVAVGNVQVLSLRWDSIHRIARFYPRMASRFHENLSKIIDKRLLQDSDSPSYQDELSGLYSASFLQELLNCVTDKAHRYNEPLCLIILSIERDELIIKNYGRQAHRWLFREIAKSVKKSLRKVDLLSRWSGGEFIIMLQRTDYNTLEEIIWRLEENIKQTDFGLVDVVNIQARWAYLREGEAAQSLIERAKTHDVAWELTYENRSEQTFTICNKT